MVTITVYGPENVSLENVSLANAAVVKRIDNHFKSWPESQVKVRLGYRLTPCALAVITDHESEAYTAGHGEADHRNP